MADAKQCDRCKRFYRDIDDISNRPGINGRRPAIVSLNDSDFHKVSCYDLCSECMNKLVKFIKMEDNDA